eukprot:jgi/Chrzof1/3093/Cz12g11140.t1
MTFTHSRVLHHPHPNYTPPECSCKCATQLRPSRRRCVIYAQPQRTTSQTVHPGRRTTLYSVLVLPSLLGQLFEEQQPQAGNCPTCIGAVDGTLGSCSGIATCSSTYDDRPQHFVAPWAFDGSHDKAVQQLTAVVSNLGGSIEQQQAGYIRAVFRGMGGADDVEFLLADDDNTVQLRSSSRLPSLPDGGRNKRRLEAIRTALGWEEVPVLRNRSRALVFVESPWDSFGPVPPTDADMLGLDAD